MIKSNSYVKIAVDSIEIYTFTISKPNSDPPNNFFEIQGLIIDRTVIYNRWGKQVYEAENYQGEWTAEGQSEGMYYYNIWSESDEYRGWIHVAR